MTIHKSERSPIPLQDTTIHIPWNTPTTLVHTLLPKHLSYVLSSRPHVSLDDQEKFDRVRMSHSITRTFLLADEPWSPYNSEFYVTIYPSHVIDREYHNYFTPIPLLPNQDQLEISASPAYISSGLITATKPIEGMKRVYEINARKVTYDLRIANSLYRWQPRPDSYLGYEVNGEIIGETSADETCYAVDNPDDQRDGRFLIPQDPDILRTIMFTASYT